MSLEPTDAEILTGAIDSRLLDLHTAIPGKIVTYNPVLQVADVQIVVHHPLEIADGSTLHEEYAVVPNVKVRWPRAGGFSQHWPLTPGDHVLLIACEASIAMWRETGEVGEIGDLRRHDLSHCIAIPGIEPDANPIPLLDAIPGTVCHNGPGVWRYGSVAADFVAHATSTSAAIAALQTQVSALQIEIAAIAGAVTAVLAIAPLLPAHVTAYAAGPAAVITAAAIVLTQAANVATQEALIPATKLKAE